MLQNTTKRKISFEKQDGPWKGHRPLFCAGRKIEWVILHPGGFIFLKNVVKSNTSKQTNLL